MANDNITKKEADIKALQNIYSRASMAPYFKDNPRYPLKGCAFYIAYDDVRDYKYIIRSYKIGENEWSSFRSEMSDPVVAEYTSVEELIADGWQLD
jgi:hypothetical protein